MIIYHKILIIQTAFVGDVILATSLPEKLKQYFPTTQIDFLVRKGNESLLQNNPHLHQIFIFDKKQNKISQLWKLLSQIRKEKYDLVINLQRFFSTGFLTAFSGAKQTIGFDKNPLSWLFTQKFEHNFDKGLHEIQRNQQLIAAITDIQPALPKLYPSVNDYEKVKIYKEKPYICIAPSSIWFTKRFPIHKWIEFLKLLYQNYTNAYKIYLLGAPDDYQMCEEIAKSVAELSIENLAGKITFLQSAALMQEAKMNFVNDSAPLHIASAMNAPTAAIFCSTIPDFGFGPLASKSYIIQTPKNLPCKPCGIHGRKACPLGHFKCAEGILSQDLEGILKLK